MSVQPLRHEHQQVVNNLATGILSLLRTFYLGLGAIGYGTTKGLLTVREACLVALKRLDENPPKKDPNENDG